MSSFAIHQNGDCVGGTPVKQLPPLEYDDCGEVNVFPQIPSEFYDAGEDFGEPDILPRMGDEYQAELPPLIRDANHKPYSEVGHHSLQNFFIGLPIPLIWINCVKSEGLDSIHLDNKNVTEMMTFCNGNIERSVRSEEKIRSSPAEEKIRLCTDGGRLMVPGLLSESWSDADKASFLLALYIFEKNFVEVRRFVGSKDMGAILSFYYGDFYGSDVYHRWSEGRKTKSKKCVYGQRIFSGLRQQELMSRLLHRVSEDCKSALLKVSKTFSEEKMSLVEYVSSLKAVVGMNLLVEAVAVGSGKQDLTGMALEPLRSNHVTRSEIPAGKACSALTTAEIIKFLSGDYRLSKARSNDLFWEAVWPRLLARGWHSEQPQNQGYIAGSKCLVFLLPGVKKFSRRKLVKGDHFFDSVTDVLSKVAKDPALIDLDNEEANDNQNTEKDDWISDVKMEEDETTPPTRQRHSYLQPRTPNRSVDSLKFTVVDTCLSDGKIRELRSLPRDISSTSISHRPQESAKRTIEDNTGESDTMNSITLDAPAGKSGPKKQAGKRRRDDDFSCQDLHALYPDVSKPSAPLKKKKDSGNNQKPRKVSRSLSGRKLKQGYADDIAPISKRCSVSTGANTHENARDGVLHSKTPRLENGTSCCSSGVHESNEHYSTQVGSWHDKQSSGSSSKESPCESIECSHIGNVNATEPSQENPQPQLLIDLNLPHVSPELENDSVGPATNFSSEPDGQSVQPDGLPAATVAAEVSSEQQSMGNTRRLSTRYRPPTTRALEAVAGGYLSISRRKKGRDSSSVDAQPCRPLQQPRLGPGPNESPCSSVASQTGEASQIAEAERGASTSGTSNIDNKPNDPPEANQEEPASKQ